MSGINWAGLRALFEKHPLPWRRRSDTNKFIVVDAEGREVSGEIMNTTAWLTDMVLTVINAAAKPEPPFEPGLYPIKLNRGGDVKCPANEPWVTFFHDQMAFDGFRLANPAAVIGKRIEPEFPS